MKRFLYHPHEKYQHPLVRSETVGDGNCFYRSILLALDDNYKLYTDKEQLEMVLTFKRECAESLTYEIYKTFGEVLKIFFMKNLLKIIQDNTYKNIFTETNAYIDLYISIFNNKVLLKIFNESTTDFYKTFIDKCVEYLSKYNNRKLEEKIMDFLVPIFNAAHQNGFEQFKQEIEQDGVFTDNTHMRCIQMFIQKNIIIIDNNTGLVYTGLNTFLDYDPELETILLLWKDNNHFENIGEYASNVRIKRIFTDSDEIIQKLKEDIK